MYTCKTGNFTYKHLFFNVCVVVEGIYTCNTGHFGKNPLCLCIYFCSGYVHMYDWDFWKQVFVFMIMLVYTVCTHIRMGILATNLCGHDCVVIEGMYTCNNGHFGNNPL